LAPHPLVNDHAGCVARTVRKGHSFPRKDKLMFHVKEKHGCAANVDNWYEDVVSDWKRQCGFCGMQFTKWDERCEHVGQHFLKGYRMIPDWKDPWPLDSDTVGQSGDDDDDEDDAGDDEGGEDNHDDIYEAEPDQNSNNSAYKDSGGPESFQNSTSNEGRTSPHEVQRQRSSFQSANFVEVDSGSRRSEPQISESVKEASNAKSQKHQSDDNTSYVFKHIRKLGYGTFGAVDEVEHRASKFHFARKTIRLRPQRSASSLAQAQREVTALRRLKHPHIINIVASYSWDGHLAIIMFPVAERNLSEFLLDENATTLPQVSKLAVWIGCLISAVSYIHRHSCYHMDIKPHNILISGSHVMLADFGGALTTDKPHSNSTFERSSIITPMYCAPEIAYSNASLFLPGASDIFSLGCVFLEMVTVMHREKLQTLVDFQAFGSTNAAYNNNLQKTCMWINHLSYIDETLGLPKQSWLQVIQRMLSVNSKERPAAEDIVHSYLIHNIQEKREKTEEENYLVISSPNDSFALIDAARLWLDECHLSHERCQKPGTDFVPSRILDVTTYNDSIKLQPTFVGFSGSYVTLSHCWGGGEILKTTKATLDSMTSGIEISSLPAKFAAAVHLTKALGFKYLWIDSLCIIQDCQEDWVTESSQMGKIYSHSSLTISAVSGEPYSLNVESRMLHYNPDLSKSGALCESCANGITGFESLTEDTATTMLLDSPWFQRAWIFQERLLSSRLLYFSSTSMAWECNSSYTTLDTVGRLGKALRLPFAEKTALSDPKTHLSVLQTQPQVEDMAMWKDIIREYSRRKLTFAKDKLPALAGVASKIAEKTGYAYVAGLWRQDLLPTGLHWCRDFATIPIARPPYRAPSWSWASIDSPVVWSKSLPEENVSAEVEVIHCKISLPSKISPFGAVSGGYIEIKGLLKEVIVKRSGSEQLLERPSLTPFAFAQWDALEDEQETLLLDREQQNQDRIFWCLKTVKGVGLILKKKDHKCFERVGLFWIHDELVSKSDANDDWDLRTITIV
jgi:serine/threonine protein kinase